MHEEDDWPDDVEGEGCLAWMVLGVFAVACVVVLAVVFHLGHRGL